jgi:hypothetical protein
MYNGPNLLSDTVHIGEHDKDSKPINTFYKLTKKKEAVFHMDIANTIRQYRY